MILHLLRNLEVAVSPSRSWLPSSLEYFPRGPIFFVINKPSRLQR